MAKALSDPKEIAAVPTTEPVLIELPSEVTEAAPAVTPAPKKQEDDPAVRLTQELEASKTAQQIANDRADKAEKDRRDALALADQRANDLREATASQQRSERELITGSLSGAQAELSSAKSEYAKASEMGDFTAQADANAKIARASQRVLHFEQMAADIELRKERTANEPVRTVDPITAIDSNPNLIPKEKEWLKAHPEAIIDPKLNAELGVAYNRATREGHIRGTPEYFDFLETFMGYKKAPKKEDGDDDQQTRIAAAPVSRGDISTSGQRQQSPSQITLTPEQREMARSMGITDVAYARQALALQQAKKSEPEKYYTPAGR